MVSAVVIRSVINMKETEFINNNNRNIEDFFGSDIPEIEHADEAIDEAEGKTLGDLTADLDNLVNEAAPFDVKFTSKGANVNMKITSKDGERPFTQDMISEIINENALNDTMIIDMDMNKKDDPDEVGFTDTENERISDQEQLDIIYKDIVKDLNDRNSNGESTVYDAAMLDRMATFFATYYSVISEKNKYDKILYTPEEYNKKISTIKKKYTSEPFFEFYLKMEGDSGVYDKDVLTDIVNDYYQAYNRVKKEREDRTSIFGKNVNSGLIDYETLIKLCHHKAKSLTTSRSANASFKAADINSAAELVILNTLTTNAAKKTIMEKCKAAGRDVIDLAKLNAQIVEMRKEVSKDPIFIKMMLNRTPKTEFYKEYRNAVTAEINNNIKSQKQKQKALGKDKKRKTFAEHYLENTKFNISNEQIEQVQLTYVELVALNKGKKPSEHMEKLIDAYETFIKEYGMNGGTVSGKTIEQLNQSGLKYYDKRQGIISGPSSDKGQARLGTVEKLLKTTEPLMKNVNSEVDKAYKKHAAAEKKQGAVKAK